MSSEVITDGDWCRIVLSGADEAAAPVRGRLRGGITMKDVLLEGDKKLPTGCVIKIWYALLRFVGAAHQAGQQVIRAHLETWLVKPPNRKDTAAQTRAIGFTYFAYKDANGIDELPGEVFLAADMNLPLFSLDKPLPDSFGVERYAAPEARSGEVVTPAADVYMAARVCLDLLTGRPVAVTHEDVLHVLAVLRLFRSDLPAAVLMALSRSLATEPAERPQTAVTAAEEVAQAVAVELAACKTPWRRFAPNPARTGPKFSCYRRIALGLRKHEEAASTFLDVTTAYDDDLLFEQLDDDLIIAAVLDGVSNTDVGSGAVAAASAKHGLLAYLTGAVKRSRQKGNYPDPNASAGERFGWLQRLAADAVRAAHVAIVKCVRKEFARELTKGRVSPQTTATVALIHGDFAVVAWVGDSPAMVVDRTGAIRLSASQTAGNLALVRSGLESARALSNPSALAGAIGAIGSAPNDLGVKMTPVRLREEMLLVVGTDGVLAHVGDDEEKCMRFIAEQGRAALGESSGSVESSQKLFNALWDESSRRGSKDDRTLLVFAGEFAPSD